MFFISDAGTGEGMGSETIVAVSGLIGLGAAVLTGALWDSPPVSALLRLRENLRSQGRHAMPRYGWAGRGPAARGSVPRASNLSLTHEPSSVIPALAGVWFVRHQTTHPPHSLDADGQCAMPNWFLGYR